VFVRLLIAAVALAACGSPRPAIDPIGDPMTAAPGQLAQVVVLGTIHAGHRASRGYSLPVLREIIRAVKPDVVLTEIPPDRLGPALAQFRAEGSVSEARVVRFPEYTEALFPLLDELGVEVVGCSAWTAEMADERRTAEARLRIERPAEASEVDAAISAAEKRLADLGDDPSRIHSDEYDAIVTAGMEPYDRLWNDALGAGGWSNINKAHLALIGAAIEARPTRPLRTLVMFGAWHKGPLRAGLTARTDVELVELASFWP